MKLDNIDDILKENYHYLIHTYNENSILGIFATGLINYGYAETSDETPFSLTAVYLPTFEELILTKPIDKQVGPIHLKDIRLMYNATKDFSYNTLELLFTDGYRLINPAYANTFNTLFIKNREEIGRYCEYDRILRAESYMLDMFTKGDLFNAARLAYSAKMFVDGETCFKCFRHDDEQLWKYKTGEEKPTFSELASIFTYCKDNADRTERVEISGVIKRGILQIMMLALDERVDFDTFFETLTAKEKEAYNSIIEELQNQNSGFISIVKMIEKYNLSRPTYTNTLNKMEKAKIAEIKNKGVKGTFIQFL